MPRASSPCPTPGCPELKPCPTHHPQPWAGSQRRQRIGKSGWQQQRDNHKILKRHGRTCYLCGGTATEVDHVVNLAARGSDDEANKRPICDPCHRRKTQNESARARWGGVGP